MRDFTYPCQLIFSAAWSTDSRKILRSSLGSVGRMSVMGGQYLLGVQERPVAASGYAAANSAFRIRNLPRKCSATALGRVGGKVHSLAH